MPVVAVVVNLMMDQKEREVALVVLMPVQVMEMVVVMKVMQMLELDLVVVDHIRICHQELHKEQGMVVPVLSSSHILPNK